MDGQFLCPAPTRDCLFCWLLPIKEVWTEFVRDVLELLLTFLCCHVCWIVCVGAALNGQNFHSVVQWSGDERGAHKGKRCKVCSVRDPPLSLDKKYFSSGITNRWAWLKSALLCRLGELCKAMSSQRLRSLGCVLSGINSTSLSWVY